MHTRLDRCKAACPDADLMEDATQGLRSLQHMAVPSSRDNMVWDRWIPFLTGQQGSIGSRMVTVDDIHQNLRFSHYPRSLPSLKPPKITAMATACTCTFLLVPLG
ncbi:hypothetical protein FALCPG4_006229 [Fusarium falciforme]